MKKTDLVGFHFGKLTVRSRSDIRTARGERTSRTDKYFLPVQAVPS